MERSVRQKLFDNFDAEFYMARKATGPYQQMINAFLSDWMFEVFSEGNISGEKLLDIGTGPNLNSVLYAYPHFNQIYLSDFSKRNREFLEGLRHGRHSELMQHYFDEAVKRGGSVKTSEEMKKEVLSKTAEVLYCDITNKNPLSGNQQSGHGQFDAVTTCWCINSAVDNLEEYKEALRNITSLIKPGGYLVLMDSIINRCEYDVNNVKYPSVFLDVEQIKKFIDTAFSKTYFWKEQLFDRGGWKTAHNYNVVAKIH